MNRTPKQADKTCDVSWLILLLIKFFKTLHVLASIGHPQVLKLFVKKIAVILGIHAYDCHTHASEQQGIRHTEDKGTKRHEYLK
jgi:hypothetical protein